jgi:hypothetical protein
MSDNFSAGTAIRASTKHVVGFFQQEEESNALKYAGDVPMSNGAKIGAGIAGVVIPVLGAILFIGIHKFYHKWVQAAEKQTAQAEMACGVAVGKIENKGNGERYIHLNLSTGDTVLCTERKDGLFISTNGGKEVPHPELKTLTELKKFFQEDIQNNSDFYVEKNPGNVLIQLFDSASRAGDINGLFDLMEVISQSVDFHTDFEKSVRQLEETIEKKYPKFRGMLQVEVTPIKEQPKNSIFEVNFGGFLITRLAFPSKCKLDSRLFELTSITHDDMRVTVIAKPKTLEALSNKLNKSTDSRSFEVNVLKLSNFYQQTDENFRGLRLKVEQGETSSTVIVSKVTQESEKQIGRVQFEGNLSFNSRFFELDKDSTYRLKPDVPLQMQELYSKSLSMNEAWHNLNSTTKKTVLKEAKQRIKEPDILQIRPDMNRVEDLYPDQSEDPDVWTKESFRTLFQTYFKPDITQYSAQFKEIYAQYSALNLEDKIALWRVVSGQEKVTLDQDVGDVKSEFDKLGPPEKTAMVECFEFLCVNKYKGTDDEEFKAAIQTLPFEKQVVLLIAAHQGFKAPIRVAYPEIVFNRNQEVCLQPVYTHYHYKVSKVSEETKTIEIELQYHVDYEPLGNERKQSKDKSPIVAHEVVTAKYTVSIPESGQLVDVKVKFHEDELKFNLVVLNQDGSVPQNCKTVCAKQLKPKTGQPTPEELQSRRSENTLRFEHMCMSRL